MYKLWDCINNSRAKQPYELIASSDNLLSLSFSLTTTTHMSIHAVTLIATARKDLRRVRSLRQLRNYRFEVNRVLKGHFRQSSNVFDKRNLRAVILGSNLEHQSIAHLETDNQYILNGRMVDNVLHISGPQYIHQYSKRLETHIQSC